MSAGAPNLNQRNQFNQRAGFEYRTINVGAIPTYFEEHDGRNHIDTPVNSNYLYLISRLMNHSMYYLGSRLNSEHKERLNSIIALIREHVIQGFYRDGSRY